MKPHLTALSIALLCMVTDATESVAQLRVVTYNTATAFSANPTPRPGMDAVFAAIGSDSQAGIAKPIDVLILQEQSNSATSTQAIVDLLDGLYGAGTYARATLDGDTNGAGRPGLVYNTQSVSLQSQIAFGTLSTSAGARQTLRYQLRPVGYGSDADFYVFSSHLKASQGGTNTARRLAETQSIRDNSDALGQGAHIIYAGDYNIYTSSESAYQEMLSAGNGQAFDPIDRPGSWHNNSSYADLHTQSPYDPNIGDGTLIGGGVDDRFDLQHTTGEFLDDEGLSYIAGTYHTFGNNGTHGLNNAINSATNTALPISVLNKLATVSDHLPVTADYQLPARMQLAVGSYPTRMLAGANATVPVDVWNSANVVASNGADELDYALTASGSLTGSANGSDAALGGVDTRDFHLDTSAIGSQSGQVLAISSSQQVANGSLSESINFTVVDHANPSFDALTDVDTLSIDLGVLAPDGSTQTPAFEIHNLMSGLGPTANLDLDGMIGSGDTSVLGLDVAPFQNLAAGDALSFNVELDTSTSGIFNSTWTLDFSDEDLPGENTLVDSLVLELSGQVALPGDANLNGAVDAVDFVIWNANKFTSGTNWATGDFDFNGFTDGIDFSIWNANKFTSLNLRGVPEPNLSLLLGMLMWSVWVRSRQISAYRWTVW